MPILDDLGLSNAGEDEGLMDVGSAPAAPVATAAPAPTPANNGVGEDQAAAEAQQLAANVQTQYSSKISSLLASINEGTDVDAYFYDVKSNKITLTREYIEMILQEYGQATQNMGPLQKFIQMDSKLDKALREYRVDIQSLLSSVITPLAKG